MPTLSLDRLTELHRKRQLALQVAAGKAIGGLFEQLTPEDIVDPKSPAVEDWLQRSTKVTLAMRSRSVFEGSTFYDRIRAEAVPGEPPMRHEPPEPPSVEQIRTSLTVTGVVRARKRIEDLPSRPQPFGSSDLDRLLARQRRGDTPERESLVERQKSLIDAAYPSQLADALRLSASDAGAAAARHVANGGREQIQDSTKRDRRAIGWVRITSGKPCYFCAMLAGRGPVYKEDSFADSDALFDGAGHHKVHDNCGCSMRQVYSRGPAEIPLFNLELEARWEDLTRQLDGASPSLDEWRNYYDGSTSRRK